MATPTVTVKTSRSPGNANERSVSIDAALGSSMTFGTPGVAAVAAAGTTLGTGAPIAGPGFQNVSGASGTNGITLPSTSGSPGAAVPIPIYNSNASNALLVYPNTSTGTINGGSAGAALSVAAGKSCILWPIDSSDDWISIPKTPS